ncbi:60S ribosomal protein L6 [Dictyocoela muelleri]|nr:60S ribosomal protein L6 [Dictyocoela muelleri]
MKVQKLKIMPLCAGPYPEEDIPNYIQKISKKLVEKPRIQREDIQIGHVVIVLEGEFTGMRVIVVGIKNFNLICIGIGLPMFKIDQRYVLKTSLILNIKNKVEIKNYDELEECGKLFGMKVIEGSEYDKVIEAELEKSGFMRAYFTRKFELPKDYDFYELNY